MARIPWKRRVNGCPEAPKTPSSLDLSPPSVFVHPNPPPPCRQPRPLTLGWHFCPQHSQLPGCFLTADTMEGPPVGQDWYTNLCDTGSGGDCPRAYFVGCDQFGRTRHRLIRLDNRQDPLDLSHYCAWNKGCLEYFLLCVAGLGIGSGVLTSKHTQKIRRTYGIKGNHCRDIATGIFCQPCSLIRNDLEIRRRQSDKEGHELGPVLSPPVPLGEERFRPMYSMPVTEGYQSEPLMTTASSIEASARGSHWHSSEDLRVRASSVAKSARRSHSHPQEPLVSTTSSVAEFPGGSHAHPAELLVAVARSLAASSRVSHSHPSETLVPTSSPVAAASRGAYTYQYAEDFTTGRMFPMYPTEQDVVEYERCWEESSPPPQSPQEESPLEALDRALDTLDRRAQLLTPISEGDSLEDTRGQRKENRLQFPQICHWLKGMSPQPGKSPVDTAVLTPGPGTSPVIHEQQNVMSQRGSPLSDTSGRHNIRYASHNSTEPPSKAKNSTTLSEPRPRTQADVLASSLDVVADSSPGSQRQRSLQADALTSSPYSIVTKPSESHQHCTLQVDVISSTPISRHSNSITREAMEDIPDEGQQHSIRADPEVPAVIDSPMPVRGISPGKLFELLTIVDPEDYLMDVGASPEDVGASPEDHALSLEDIPDPSKDLGVPSELIKLPSERIGVLTDEAEMPADESSIPFEDVAVPSDHEPAHSFEVLSDRDMEFAHSFRASSDGKPTAFVKAPSDRESARSLRVRSDRESARSVRVPSEELVLPLDRKSAHSFSSDGIISAGQVSNRHDAVESDKSLHAERQTLDYTLGTDLQMSKDVIPVKEEIVSATPVSAPEQQSKEPSDEPANDRDLLTRPQVFTSDVLVQERSINLETPVSASKPSQSRDHSLSREYHLPTPKLKGAKSHGIEMIERLPTPELTRHLGDGIHEPPQDQPVPKPKGWAQRASSPVFTLIRQYSFRAGKRASARSTEDSTLGDDRAASPSPSRRARENTLGGDSELELDVIADGVGQGGQPKRGAVRLLLSLSEGTPVNEAAQDSQGPRGSGDVGKSVDNGSITS
ncbi:hypothetical protein B0T18DRAFT_403785 [Schizothecium vesticola]|uniref:Uncharacterized protein n=1 Tax=Schizothecium vesticola TaxID=314040 RepID=A0AA40KAQ6_9PEZI|nr:hypothetical protein B0T18DRAFT_403785 [Schizothecium vesticola]